MCDKKLKITNLFLGFKKKKVWVNFFFLKNRDKKQKSNRFF